VARVEGAWKSEGRNSRNAKGPGPVKNWYGGGPEKACDVLLYIRRLYSAVDLIQTVSEIRVTRNFFGSVYLVLQSLILLGVIKNRAC
jgi:hypothetical protein